MGLALLISLFNDAPTTTATPPPSPVPVSPPPLSPSPSPHALCSVALGDILNRATLSLQLIAHVTCQVRVDMTKAIMELTLASTVPHGLSSAQPCHQKSWRPLNVRPWVQTSCLSHFLPHKPCHSNHCTLVFDQVASATHPVGCSRRLAVRGSRLTRTYSSGTTRTARTRASSKSSRSASSASPS